MNSLLRRFCTGLILLSAVGTASAQTVAPPNVHILFDTSGSMRELPQVEGSRHSEFFDITTGGCFNPRLDAVQLNRSWNPDTLYAVPDTGTMLGSDTAAMSPRPCPQPEGRDAPDQGVLDVPR